MTMVRVSTFVFFDIETTGLPHQERNRTKIIELSLLAVTREDIRRNKGKLPPMCKLSLLLNPKRPVLSTEITGLNNDMLKYAPTFKQSFHTIKSFLEDLKKPVCLVAHNGNTFDFKILLAECLDAGVELPDDILCIDSLKGFRKLLKYKTSIDNNYTLDADHDDEWPDLNITPEQFQEIDELCKSFGDTTISSDKGKTIQNIECEKKKRESYKLTEIYRKLLFKQPENAHRAEDDCLMLLECVSQCQNTANKNEDFLRWMDDNCKKLNEITPLQRK